MKHYAAIENTLRHYRVSLALSQTQMAVYCKIGCSMIYRVETCGHYPKQPTRQAIVTYLAQFFPGLTELDIWPHPPVLLKTPKGTMTKGTTTNGTPVLKEPACPPSTPTCIG